VASEASTDEEASQYYRWSLADASLFLEKIEYGNHEQLLEWLAGVDYPIVLVIPGEKVVAQSVAYKEKEKRHFAKMLPYEMEDKIIDEVEDLHFVIGQQQETFTKSPVVAEGQADNFQVTVAYIDKVWFETLWRSFVDKALTIDYCVADYQCIDVADNETIFWFNGDRLSAHSYTGLGFSSEQTMAPLLLKSFVSSYDYREDRQERFSVYVTPAVKLETSTDDEVNQNSLQKAQTLFHTLVPEIPITFYSQSPPLSIEQPQVLNFCSGAYGKKISFLDYFKVFRSLGLLATVAILAFVAINLADIYSLKAKNQHYRELIEAAYRTVVPEGAMGDPVRELTRRLGQSVDGEGKSQAVFLLSKVAPVIQALAVDVSAINYSNKEKSLRINIQAESFNLIEKLRTEIEQKGLVAELLGSNAIDNKFQARLMISLEAR
jgi:general secretion pathway protein L